MGNPFSSIKHKNHLKSEASHTTGFAVVVILPRFSKRLAGASDGAISNKTAICHLSLVNCQLLILFCTAKKN